jgi:hypothetical protein
MSHRRDHLRPEGQVVRLVRARGTSHLKREDMGLEMVSQEWMDRERVPTVALAA